MEKTFRSRLKNLIEVALLEDGDDATSNAVFAPKDTAKARLLCKEDGILAALDEALEVFRYLEPGIKITKKFKDKDIIKKGDELGYVEGKVTTLLRGERICLNILQRSCGIASKTKKLTDLISHTKCRLLDTRKTTPGLRFIEKYAVLCGGALNHRMGLNDMIMLKDNHIDRAGGITSAVNAVRKSKYKNLKIEVECRNISDVEECIKLNIDRIMLDNMSPSLIKECVKLTASKIPLEASGGINQTTLKEYAETGVDFISVGELTHSVKSLDISFKIIKTAV
jgi:nicotinate-nucleotide pyrophosphorylase (carboxylating)